MKNLGLASLLLLVGWAHEGLADVTCRTQSGGYQFTESGYNERDVADRVINKCLDARMYRSECQRNLVCEDSYNHGPGRQDYGRIWSSNLSCRRDYNGLCTAYIEFEMGNQGQTGIATVTDLDTPGAREQKFACHMGRSPMNPAPWIQRGHRYLFKLYAVRDCYESTRNAWAVSEVIVEGR